MSATVMPTASTPWTRWDGCASGPRPAATLSQATTKNKTASTLRRRVVTTALPGSPRRSAEPLEEVIAYPEGVRHDGERGVHRAAGRKEARVDDVEVVDL